MGTAWETLIHLSRFMKYLLIEVLPKEQLDSPKYVSESLLELLDVTRECLNLIRSANGLDGISCRRSFQQYQDSVDSKSQKSYKNNLEDNKNYKIHSDGSSRSEGNTDTQNTLDRSIGLNMNCYSSPANPGYLNSPVIHNSTIISQNFLRLNNITLNSNCFSSYCLPCDSIFTSDIQWKNHYDDWDHLSRIKKIICTEVFCNLCNLLVYGNGMIASIYMDFHYQQKHKTSTCASSEYLAKDMRNSRERFMEEPAPKETNEVLNSTSIYSDPVSISYNFDTIHNEMIKGFKNEGFYCHFCGKIFYSKQNWLEHLQKREFHGQKENINGKFTTCKTCSFTIFATENALNELIIYHKQNHNAFLENLQKTALVKALNECPSADKLTTYDGQMTGTELSRSTSKSEGLERSTEEIYGSEEYSWSSNTSINKDKAINTKKRSYVFSEVFLKINEQIHLRNICSVFYCRPCDEHCPLEYRKDHCITSKHLRFLNSKTYKNFQGECSYCMFTVVGTEGTVHEYLKFHAEGHNNIPSYSVEEVNEHETCESVNEHRAPKSRSRHSKNKMDTKYDKSKSRHSKNKMHTKYEGHNKQKVQENQITNNVNAQLHLSVGDSTLLSSNYENTTSEFVHNASDRKEPTSFMSKLKELYMQRIEDKRSHSFAGFCIPCEFFIDSAFEWLDHLGSDNHCSILSPNDEDLNLSDINLRIFGNKTQIQSHSLLV